MLKIRDIWRLGKGLPGARDKIPQRDFPYFYTGRVATIDVIKVIGGGAIWNILTFFSFSEDNDSSYHSSVIQWR